MAGGCRNNQSIRSNSDPNQKENLIKANRALVDKDQERIKEMVQHHGWDMQTTPTGLWYQIIENGTGNLVKTGNVVRLKYKLSLLDGTPCYSSDSLGLKEFRVGSGGVESGLEEAVLMLRKGDKARFILPPHLAYGLIGDQHKIPARATIIYSIEVVNIMVNE
jgi:FKBP-type peptidyl-prolyl cis-trans isomerase FkpA